MQPFSEHERPATQGVRTVQEQQHTEATGGQHTGAQMSAHAGEHAHHAGAAARAPASHDHGQHAMHGGGHAGHSAAMFQRPFWISLVLTIPIILYAELFQQLLGYRAPAFPGSQYIGLVLGSVIYWYGGWVFLTGAVDELRRRMPGMMTLVALAISTAYFYSVAISVGLVHGMPFFWELATLVTIMLLGHWLEMRAVGSAQSALNELAKLLPDRAELRSERAERAGEAAARQGRAYYRRARRDRSRRATSVGRPGAGPARGKYPRRWRDPGGREQPQRSDDYRRIAPGSQADRRCSHRRDGQRQRLAARPRYPYRRADGAGRHHAAGRRSAEQP